MYLRPEWARAVVLGILLLVGIALQLANPQIVKVFIDSAQAGQSIEQLVWIALLFIGVTLLTQVATVAETYVAEDLGWRTTNALRTDLSRHVLELDASFHAEHTPGELIERIDGDVAAIADFFARFVVQVLGSGLFLLGVLVLLYAADWRVGALLGVCVILAVALMCMGGGFVTARERRARKASAELSGYLEERLGGLVDLKALGADTYAMQRLGTSLVERFASSRSAVSAGSLFNSGVGMIFVLGAGGALALSVGLYGGGAMTFGVLYAVFRYTTMLRQPLDRLTRQIQGFLRAAGAIGRVEELLQTRSEMLVFEKKRNVQSGALSVELDDVWFAYNQEPVLRGVSCEIQAGQVVGLLGRTGSGKTTIARLLFRLHDVCKGTVRVGGVDVRELEPEALHARVGLVTQDVQLFHASLRDNVRLFDRRISDAQLERIFRQLALGEWLESLPDGLDTVLGAGGRGLSAGEAQLVALARVFLKQPGLVILDEASSRLDPTTEWLLEQAVTRLLEGRTGLVIAHRLTTIQRADIIVTLEEGEVVECGPRSELEADPTSRFARVLRGSGAVALT